MAVLTLSRGAWRGSRCGTGNERHMTGPRTARRAPSRAQPNLNVHRHGKGGRMDGIYSEYSLGIYPQVIRHMAHAFPRGAWKGRGRGSGSSRRGGQKVLEA